MSLYTPNGGQFQNVDLNAVASNYSTAYGHNIDDLIKRVTKDMIFDAQPKQFIDLKLLGAKTPITVNSDEFEYAEMGYGREALIATAISAAAIWPATQVVTISDIANISIDTIVVYPNNAKGTVVAIDSTNSQMTIKPMTNLSVPAVAVNDSFANLSGVERDAADTISQYFRIGTTKRFNYIQMFVKALRFGRMELYKLSKSATYSNYLSMMKSRFYQQFRTDLSNAYWNGERGEVTLADGTPAKTMGGVYPSMIAAGSPTITTPVATLDAALEDLALQTEYGNYGDTRFLFAAPRYIHYLSQVYKSGLIRWTPQDDSMVKLELKGIDIGSSRIVFVPYKRFEDSASFPVSWAKKMFLLDQNNINPVQTWGEESGDTLSRKAGGTRENYTDSWISTTLSCEFNNPIACGMINVL